MKPRPVFSRLMRDHDALHGAPRSRTARGLSGLSRARPSGLTPPPALPLVPSRAARTYARPPNRLEQMVIDARLQHPILFPVSLIAAICSVSLLTFLAYQEYTRESRRSSAYPPAVEERLRLALHYTHVSPDPDTAAKYFMQAIKKADELGMDPFGRESLGIRVRFAQMLENFGHVKAAIEILDELRKDVEQELADWDRSGRAAPSPSQSDGPPSDGDQARPALGDTTRRGLVKTIIEIRAKVASLYEGDYMQDSAAAKQYLSDAITLLVQESRNPQLNGLTEDNEAGLTAEEIAAILSQMGDLYATTGEEDNAVQTYMLSLAPLRTSCNGSKSCKEVQVLANIASAMEVAMKKPGARINGKLATKSSLATARQAALKWADQAVATAEAADPDHVEPMCILAQLSARMTHAHLLLASGQKVASRAEFESLLPVLREKGLVQLVQEAEQGLQATTG